MGSAALSQSIAISAIRLLLLSRKTFSLVEDVVPLVIASASTWDSITLGSPIV